MCFKIVHINARTFVCQTKLFCDILRNSLGHTMNSNMQEIYTTFTHWYKILDLKIEITFSLMHHSFKKQHVKYSPLKAFPFLIDCHRKNRIWSCNLIKTICSKTISVLWTLLKCMQKSLGFAGEGHQKTKFYENILIRKKIMFSFTTYKRAVSIA